MRNRMRSRDCGEGKGGVTDAEADEVECGVMADKSDKTWGGIEADRIRGAKGMS